MTIGTVEKYPTEASARMAVEGFLPKLNAEIPQAQFVVPTLRALADRYKEEELPERYSTRESYKSILDNRILPKWGGYPLDKIKPMPVEQWLKELKRAPKTKGNIRGLMHLLFKCAERWGLIEMGKNPIALVRVKGCTKRQKKPRVLTREEFWKLLPLLKEPYRTMVIVAQCLGLRVSEITGLKWGDFDFDNATLLVQPGVVHGRVDTVKTEYSNDEVPLDTGLASALLEWRDQSPFKGEEDWVFANPRTGKPYHQEEILKKHIKPAAKAAGIGEDIGWHTFRHTYRSWLGATGARLDVQRELMRHASIATTLRYGHAMPEGKRKANRKVARIVLDLVQRGQENRPQKGKGLLPAPSSYVN